MQNRAQHRAPTPEPLFTRAQTLYLIMIGAFGIALIVQGVGLA